MPDTMPFWVVSLKGLVMPIWVKDIAVLFWVPLMLVAVAFDAKFTDELAVWPISFLPLPTASAGMVLFMFATRAIRVCPSTLWSSLAE